MDNMNHKVEWVEPTYGCCYMSEGDAEEFMSVVGPPDVIYNTRHEILKGYENQKPFNGDGTLYYLTWEEYQKKLPVIVRINQAMTEEKKCRYELISSISRNIDLKKTLISELKSLNEKFKKKAGFMFENKSSMKRKIEEGVKANNGNILKGVSMLTTPAISDLVFDSRGTKGTSKPPRATQDSIITKDTGVSEFIEEGDFAAEETASSAIIAEEISNSVNKAQEKMEAIKKSIIAKAISKMKAAFEKMKEAIIAIKEQAEKFAKMIMDMKQKVMASISAAIAAGAAAAEKVMKAIEKMKEKIAEQVEEAMTLALTTISSAFSGLATLVFTALPFASFVFFASGGGEHGSYSEDECSGVKKENIPEKYRNMAKRCFKPKNLLHIGKANKEAEKFSKQHNGIKMWIPEEKLFIVFYEGPSGEKDKN